MRSPTRHTVNTPKGPEHRKITDLRIQLITQLPEQNLENKTPETRTQELTILRTEIHLTKRKQIPNQKHTLSHYPHLKVGFQMTTKSKKQNNPTRAGGGGLGRRTRVQNTTRARGGDLGQRARVQHKNNPKQGEATGT
ncbi:hypothetical protein AMECASPLE_016593 [Ameca splendens]|uniref:Uncharacterized protein n=1 Tax=Ameca splendens TaxID=208324 RepID=A0ABV0YP57_9TELE